MLVSMHLIIKYFQIFYTLVLKITDLDQLLKVSKSQNKFMRSSFLPKYERNILRISTLASKERSNKEMKALYHTNYGLFN